MTNDNNEMARRLCDWYEQNKRPLPFRETRDAYRIWISEIMAQQTRMTALIPYYQRFVARFPTIMDLACATEDEVLLFWQGLGYYARARNMHAAAKIVCEQYGGRFPRDMKRLRALPGIGDYTAGAIASIAFDGQEPAVDGNAMRVFARLFAIEADVKKPKTKNHVRSKMRDMMANSRPSVFTQAVMELGALVCLPASPQCQSCPLIPLCMAKRDNRTDELPVRSQPGEKRVEDRLILMLLSAGGCVLLRRRSEKLLQNLWEFPGFLSTQCMETQLNAWGVKREGQAERGPDARHVFTHLIWRMCGVIIRATNTPDIDGARWVEADAMDRYAMPAALKTYRRYVLQWMDTMENGEEAV